ncbi:hypothetical protein GCM10009798_42120 [Nocardioides panacihumi]|uniref:Uncharacterized protein n=1 Tax=Nocardioides panacihumi TaxID=400774 RepID=A0ABN2RXD3_9ACTN
MPESRSVIAAVSRIFPPGSSWKVLRPAPEVRTTTFLADLATTVVFSLGAVVPSARVTVDVQVVPADG